MLLWQKKTCHVSLSLSCDWPIVKSVDRVCVCVCVPNKVCPSSVHHRLWPLLRIFSSHVVTSSRRHVVTSSRLCLFNSEEKKKKIRTYRTVSPRSASLHQILFIMFVFFILTFCHTVWLRAITTVTHTDVTSRPRRVKCVVHFQLCLSWCHAVQLLIRRQVWQSLPYFLPHRVSPSLSQTGLTLSPKQRETRRDRQMAVTEGEEERNEELEGEQKKKRRWEIRCVS